MKKSKKIISLLLSVLMIITSVPLMAVNSFAAKSGNYEYELLEDGTVKITDYNGSESNVTIPSEIDGYTVTSIGDSAFRGCTSLESVTIPDSVTSIGYYAFEYCTSLTSVTIPNSVTSIGKYAFSGCESLESVTIPDSVTSIGEYAFRSCTSLTNIDVSIDNKYYSSFDGVLFNKVKTKVLFYPSGKTDPTYSIPNGVTSIGNYAFGECTSLESVTIPDSVTSIGACAFGYCTSLESITIPDSVTSIGNSAFWDCTSLTNIDVSIDNKYYSSFDGVLFNKVKTKVLFYPSGKTDPTYSIPSGVTSIDDCAFYYCTSLTSVTIPDSVTNIYGCAFLGCTSLSDIVIGNGVTYIRRNSFANTAYYNDESNWDNGILYIGNYLISTKSDITGDVVIKEGTRVIAADAFWDCDSLTGITIPESVITLCDSFSFKNNTVLTKIEVSSKNKSYSSLDGVLFNKDKTELICYPSGKTDPTYSIPNGVTSIGNYAFWECTSLESVTIPDSVTSIGYSAFQECSSLESVTIPDSVTSIGYSAFEYCTSLESVTIPDSVTSIGYYAFEYCTSLTSVTIGNSVKSIGEGAFARCRSLTSVTIPDSVTSIGYSAFRECSSLESVTIPDSVTSIGECAFYYCTSLTNIDVSIDNKYYSSLDGVLFNKDKTELICYPSRKTDPTYSIPNGVTSIGNYAFGECTSLESVTIPDSVTSIGACAFGYCTSLESITIPDSVTSIGEDAFDCTAYYNDESNWDNGILYIGNHLINAKRDIAGSVEIKQGTKVIAAIAFCDCELLESIIIPDSITDINGGAFYGCDSLDNVVIPDSVKVINPWTFAFCYSLKNITIPSSVTSIGATAFGGCTSLNNITIPDSVTSIGENAFADCSSLKQIIIPDSVTRIDDHAFGYYGIAAYGVYGGKPLPMKSTDFTIYGVAGSEAERYANENSLAFKLTGEAPKVNFPDVSSSEWYYNAIKFNVDNNYFHGYGNGYFGPANNIQRQDFVVVLAKIAGADLSAYAGQNGGFADVPTNDYYSAAVAWAKDNHILSGYANGKFGVGDPITREQACLIFYNYCNGSVSGDVDAVLAGYPDGGNVSDWARTAVAWAAENHVVGGNGKLNPAGNANRAEMAQIIMNMSNNGIL